MESMVQQRSSTLTGYEKGQESELGAVNVMTGVYTGRSPKDKFIVVDENSKDTIWWTSDPDIRMITIRLPEETWEAVKEIAKEGTL
jgi:phosphoenolpyruvate carboxykinase (ATP)